MLYAGFGHMVPRGLEPRTLRLLAVRSNQLSYETLRSQPLNNVRSVCGGKIWVDSGNGRQAGAENSREPKRAKNGEPRRQKKEGGKCWPRGARWRRARVGRRCRSVRACGRGAEQAPKPAGAAAATGCTPMRRSSAEGLSRPLAAAADTHTPLGAARCGGTRANAG